MIRRITLNFVPVALNLYEIRAAKGAGGDFFRAAQAQRPDLYQGLWVVSADGKFLAGYQGSESPQKWPREVLAILDSALEAFGPVTPRRVVRVDPKPHRGLGVRPDGAINLAIEVRGIYGGHPGGDGVIDSLTLTEAEWSSLAPPETARGTRWTIPEPVARQFCRILTPSTDQAGMASPNEVTAVRFVGQVQAVDRGVARLAYSGTIAMAHTYLGNVSHGEARLTGVGSFEVKSGRLLSFLMVAEGTYRAAPPYDKETLPIVAAVEWRREPERSRRPVANGSARPAAAASRRAPARVPARAGASADLPGAPAGTPPRRRSALVRPGPER